MSPARWRNRDAYDAFEARAEAPMLVASILFAGVFLATVFMDFTDAARQAVSGLLWLIWAIFAAEFLALLYLAPSKKRMLRARWLDAVIVVVPFLRPLRLLRLVAIGSSAGRSAQALSRMTRRTGIRWYFGVVLITIVAGAFLTWAAEHDHPDAEIHSLADALWWALVTTTTVGYGDMVPVGDLGRAIAAILMLVGISLLAVVTATIASFLVTTDEDVNTAELCDRIDQLEATIAELRDEHRREREAGYQRDRV
ncbi:MAG: ion transporter [Acidimicrobiia bacterium]|nr:ion transporter [Acidimicrobiia bacterium]